MKITKIIGIEYCSYCENETEINDIINKCQHCKKTVVACSCCTNDNCKDCFNGNKFKIGEINE